MNLTSIIAGVISVAQKLSPALEGTPVAAVVEAGAELVKLAQSVKAVAGESDQSALQATLDDLEPKVQAHLDRTINSLG